MINIYRLILVVPEIMQHLLQNLYKWILVPIICPLVYTVVHSSQLAYREAMLQNQWRKTVEFPTGEVVILQSPKVRYNE